MGNTESTEVQPENQLKEEEGNIYSDLKNLIKNENYKDFTIQIDDREFHVHKFLLAARSLTFAEIIRNNPEVEKLNLVDIPEKVFDTILKFIYTDEFPPDDGLDALKVFAAAGRLEIPKLKHFAATKIIDKLDEENALEILKLSNKYEHEELRQKIFDTIKRKYPKIEFNDLLATQPEVVATIIDKFEKKEEAIRMLEEEFKNMKSQYGAQ